MGYLNRIVEVDPRPAFSANLGNQLAKFPEIVARFAKFYLPPNLVREA
jgi:hypothetical protein